MKSSAIDKSAKSEPGMNAPGHRRLSRRGLVAGAGLVAGMALLDHGIALAQQATPVATPLPAARDWQAEHWVGTWATGQHIPGPGFGEEFPSQIFELGNRTLRQIVRVSIGGDQVRVRLANTFGDEPIAIGAARIALRDGDERIDPASDRVLTFSGNPAISVPAGAVVLSDPVELSVPALAELAISLYFPEPTTSSSLHGFAFQTNYLSPEGDVTADAAMPVETAIQNWVFLSGVDVSVPEPASAIVALGDSITDGAFSTADANNRWPDILAERLAMSDAGTLAVLNQGIGGNRLLHDSPAELPFFGPSALARFDRDVLAQPGVSHLIVFEGINDIGLPVMAGSDAENVSAEEMIVALRQIAERAHEHGIVAIGATITPFEGSMIYSPEGEAKRQAVNEWIRTGGAFDGVIDFDAIVQDPDQPARLLPEYDGGDQLHINDAGFEAMANGIDLELFRD